MPPTPTPSPIYNTPTARVTWFSPHASRRGSLGSGREQKARVAPLRRDACDAGAMLVRCQRPPLENERKRGA